MSADLYLTASCVILSSYFMCFCKFADHSTFRHLSVENGKFIPRALFGMQMTSKSLRAVLRNPVRQHICSEHVGIRNTNKDALEARSSYRCNQPSSKTGASESIFLWSQGNRLLNDHILCSLPTENNITIFVCLDELQCACRWGYRPSAPGAHEHWASSARS